MKRTNGDRNEEADNDGMDPSARRARGDSGRLDREGDSSSFRLSSDDSLAFRRDNDDEEEEDDDSSREEDDDTSIEDDDCEDLIDAAEKGNYSHVQHLLQFGINPYQARGYPKIHIIASSMRMGVIWM